MCPTLEASRIFGKVQLHGCGVVRFGSRGTASPSIAAAQCRLRSQLEDQFRQAIRSGRLGDGERVPSSRALAKALGLSRGLVQECYAQLQAEGYLVSRGWLSHPRGRGGHPARADPPPAAVSARPAGRRLPPPAFPTLRRPLGRAGPGLSARPAGPRRIANSTTATPAETRACARSSPPTCGASAPRTPQPTSSSSAPGWRRASGLSCTPWPAKGLSRVGFEDPGGIGGITACRCLGGSRGRPGARSMTAGWTWRRWIPAGPRRSCSPRRTSGRPA